MFSPLSSVTEHRLMGKMDILSVLQQTVQNVKVPEYSMESVYTEEKTYSTWLTPILLI